MTYQDEVYLQLRSAGLSGSLNDMLASNYRTGGAVGGTLNALGMSFLHNEGYTSGTYNDRWASYARANGLPVGVTMAVGSFSPSSVFGVSDLGAWYDPSDLLTLFQDSVGTTTVTAAGQPIGLMLDKRYGPTLGANVVVNGTFTGNSSTGWTLVTGATVGNEKLKLDAPVANVISTYSVVAGRVYRWSYSVSDYVSGSISFNVGGGTRPAVSANGTYSGIFTATATTSPRFLTAGVPRASVDNVAVQELAGSHAVQATTTARPAYRTAPSRVDYDGIDDVLVTTFASSLGANCTIVRAVPNVGVVILTGQTIGTTYSDNQDHCGLLIINRALTPFETTRLTTFMNKKAGV